jgi:hypothetical protein
MSYLESASKTPYPRSFERRLYVSLRKHQGYLEMLTRTKIDEQCGGVSGKEAEAGKVPANVAGRIQNTQVAAARL